jgi:hypothetical protein
MPDYWVFQDSLNKRAWIHRSTCSVFKGHLKGGGSEGAWHGAFETYDEARRTAKEVAPAKKGAQLNCRVCRPEIM